MTSFTTGIDGKTYAPPIDPADLLDYTLDFTGILGSDNIASVSWQASPTGIDIVTANNSYTNKTATVWLQNATIGKVFTITASVVTAGGREFERSFKIKCLDQ